MNKAYSNPKTKNHYIIPKGRLAKVDSIQNYAKDTKPKKYNGKRFVLKPYGERDNKEFPEIHKHAPQLLNGKIKYTYKQHDIFDIDKRKPKKIKEPTFQYIDKATGRFN